MPLAMGSLPDRRALAVRPNRRPADAASANGALARGGILALFAALVATRLCMHGLHPHRPQGELRLYDAGPSLWVARGPAAVGRYRRHLTSRPSGVGYKSGSTGE